VTAGEGGVADLPGVAAPADGARWAALLRVSDSLTVPQRAGVSAERCVNLVYPDGGLESMHRDAERPFRLDCEDSLSRAALRARNRLPEFQRGGADCTWNDLVAELRSLLDSAKPDIVLCPHPLLDNHRDHVFTAVALERALHDRAGKAPLVFLYVVHARGVPTYPFGPARSLVCLPPWSDDRWVAESIYSHPLTSELRAAKYLAVEAMHGVRDHADGDLRSGRDLLRIGRRELAGYLAGIGPYPATLLRRAPRPNEIYFVVSPSGLSELVGRALAVEP
jgi:hypothetical protein